MWAPEKPSGDEIYVRVEGQEGDNCLGEQSQNSFCSEIKWISSLEHLEGHVQETDTGS